MFESRVDGAQLAIVEDERCVVGNLSLFKRFEVSKEEEEGWRGNLLRRQFDCWQVGHRPASCRSGFRVEGRGLGVQGLGLRVEGFDFG